MRDVVGFLEDALRTNIRETNQDRSARQTRAYLEQPLKIAKDPLMKIRALSEFGLGFGRTAKEGEVVEVLSSTGRMLISIGRAVAVE